MRAHAWPQPLPPGCQAGGRQNKGLGIMSRRQSFTLLGHVYSSLILPSGSLSTWLVECERRRWLESNPLGMSCRTMELSYPLATWQNSWQLVRRHNLYPTVQIPHPRHPAPTLPPPLSSPHPLCPSLSLLPHILLSLSFIENCLMPLLNIFFCTVRSVCYFWHDVSSWKLFWWGTSPSIPSCPVVLVILVIII